MYVEDPGYWRFGKQALPFGKGAILDDRAMGVRLHTKFSGAGIPSWSPDATSCRGVKRG